MGICFSGSTYIDIANGNSAGHFCGIVGVGWVKGEFGRWCGCRSVAIVELKDLTLLES